MNVLSKTTIFPGVTSCVQVDIRCCSVIHQNTHVVPKCGILAPNRRHKLNRVSKKHTVCGKGSEFVVMSPYRHYSPAHMGPRCRVGGGGCMTGWCHRSVQLESVVGCVIRPAVEVWLDRTGPDWSGLTAVVGAKLCVLRWRMGSQLLSVPHRCC